MCRDGRPTGAPPTGPADWPTFLRTPGSESAIGFSTVRRADRIVVLEAAAAGEGGGRVVEDGGHDELMALDGRYATMFKLQAAHFAAPM